MGATAAGTGGDVGGGRFGPQDGASRRLAALMGLKVLEGI
jgi:hypothetical protein